MKREGPVGGQYRQSKGCNFITDSLVIKLCSLVIRLAREDSKTDKNPPAADTL